MKMQVMEFTNIVIQKEKLRECYSTIKITKNTFGNLLEEVL